LVDGTTGKIVDKQGSEKWVAHNLVFMYENVSGVVYNDKYSSV